MMRKWEKLGRLYNPSSGLSRHPKLATHAANPLAVHLETDVFRIFYSGRDSRNRSSVGAVDIDVVRRKVVRDYRTPFFEYGPADSFFSDGVSIGSCYESQGVLYMLFMGWQIAPGRHWRGDIGRLVVTPDRMLELASPAPFLGCNVVDPVSLSYPWILSNRSGGFDMWYGSTVSWDTGDGEMLHVIKHASSVDGETWTRSGLAVPYGLGRAQAFSRPTVVPDKDGSLQMWFSYRGGGGDRYRIGFAKQDGYDTWVLDLENSGIGLSRSGWDSEMIEYPFVFDHGGVRYMLYNGNGFGKTGFGLAILNEH